jgi:hypothetical protein
MQRLYAPNPMTAFEVGVAGALTAVGIAGAVGGVLVSRKASAAPVETPPPPPVQGSKGPYLSGPLRENSGVIMTRGMILPLDADPDEKVGKVRRATAFLGFAYVTVEFLRDYPDLGFRAGEFAWAVQVAPGLEPAEGDGWFSTEGAAAAAARQWITANRSKLVAVVEGADPASVGL